MYAKSGFNYFGSQPQQYFALMFTRTSTTNINRKYESAIKTGYDSDKVTDEL